jgi:hypothetical protein
MKTAIIGTLLGAILLTSCNRTPLKNEKERLVGTWEWVSSQRPHEYWNPTVGTNPWDPATGYNYDTPQSTGTTRTIEVFENGTATIYVNGAEGRTVNLQVGFGETNRFGDLLFWGFLNKGNYKKSFDGHFLSTSNDTVYLDNWPSDEPEVSWNLLVKR